MLRLILSIAGAILAIVAASSYIKYILRGDVKPHRVTWGGWTFAGVLGLLSSSEGGAGVGLIVTSVFVVLVAIIFALSLSSKYGKPGGKPWEYIAGIIAALALITRLFVNYSPAVSATIAVAADTVFFWPTLKGAWLHPELEERRPWVIGAIAEVLGIAALGNYSYSASVYSFYILVVNFMIIYALTYTPHRKKKRQVS